MGNFKRKYVANWLRIGPGFAFGSKGGRGFKETTRAIGFSRRNEQRLHNPYKEDN